MARAPAVPVRSEARLCRTSLGWPTALLTPEPELPPSPKGPAVSRLGSIGTWLMMPKMQRAIRTGSGAQPVIRTHRLLPAACPSPLDQGLGAGDKPWTGSWGWGGGSGDVTAAAL